MTYAESLLRALRTLEATDPDEIVTVVKPGSETDVVMLTQEGPVRFLSGRSRVSARLTKQLVGPGWSIEP